MTLFRRRRTYRSRTPPPPSVTSTAERSTTCRHLSSLVDHITFAEPGQTVDFQFAEPLAPGRYIIVCYIPRGR